MCRNASARAHPGRSGPVMRDQGWSGCRPSRRSNSGRISMEYIPNQWPSGRFPQVRWMITSSVSKGNQSMPWSSSQSTIARIGAGFSGRFS